MKTIWVNQEEFANLFYLKEACIICHMQTSSFVEWNLHCIKNARFRFFAFGISIFDQMISKLILGKQFLHEKLVFVITYQFGGKSISIETSKTVSVQKYFPRKWCSARVINRLKIESAVNASQRTMFKFPIHFNYWSL